MAVQFDAETIEKLRSMPPHDAFRIARNAVFATGDAGSEDFVEAYSQLVEEGILTWDEVEAFSGGSMGSPVEP